MRDATRLQASEPVGNSWRGVAFGMFAIAWGANQFVPMLVAYKSEPGLSTAVDDGLFGSYALALIAALLLGGPAADLCGRAHVVRPAVVLSILATVVLIAGHDSVPLLYLGRFLAGVASGAVFAAGSAWVQELSGGGAANAGARRAALALSAGFGLGPLITGVVAQWAPHPLVVAYLPHLLIAVVALPVVWRASETLRPDPAGPGYLARLRVPAAGQRRFLRVVVPAAPWVFGAPSLAFAVLPSLVADRLHGFAVVFSALIAAVTLGTGIAIQPVARRLDVSGRVSGAQLGLGAVVLGAAVAASAAATGQPFLALIAAVPLGGGYGLGLISGLLETQRLAGPDDLAGLTAVYYALTYVGFALPLALAELRRFAGYPVLILGVAVLAALCAAAVTSARSVPAAVAGQPGVLRSESAAEVR